MFAFPWTGAACGYSLTTFPGPADLIRVLPRGQVAQLVEQRTENPRVVGSIPTLATISQSSEYQAKFGCSMLRRTVFAALVILAACGSPRVAPITGQPDTAALARELPRLLRVSGIPGLSMAVVQNGRVVWAGAFGTINDSAQTPLNAGTIFEAASLSKPVFAYMVLRLADRGEFDLDRPLYEMLEYPRLAHDERYKRITARIVLSHGTGLPNWGGEKLTLQFDPGTEYGYSGEGFVFLQKTIERVTGRSLDELARREVFEPLGMTRSSYVWQERFAGNAAYAKNWLWQVAPANRYTQAEANAAASLLTTATDYAQFVAAVLTGRGLSPAMWQRIPDTRAGDEPGNSHRTGHQSRGAAGRPHLLSQRQQRPAVHLVHDRGHRAGARPRLLHERAQWHVARRGADLTRPRQ